MTTEPRLRRLRASRAIRDALAETRVTPSQLVVPHFVLEGQGRREPIASMPGVDRVSVDQLLHDVKQDLALGLHTVLLFGVPHDKDPQGACAADPEGVVPQAVRAIKASFGDDVTVMTDVCLCAYTTHGHCGVLDAHGHVDNDASLPRLAAMALAHAKAGADWVAPSDMMDHRVARIRGTLDASGLSGTAILAYSAKFASAYYGPFRDAAHSAPGSGDRKTYQMDPRNGREALREIEQDEREGADAVMVKPALAYLDVIRAARDATRLPLVAYNVSGEYSLVKLAAKAGLADEGAMVRENLAAIRRAGADLIITYHARDAIRNGWLP
jgi:porphobilinogen synthase